MLQRIYARKALAGVQQSSTDAFNTDLVGTLVARDVRIANYTGTVFKPVVGTTSDALSLGG
jgi:hypothetical protein